MLDIRLTHGCIGIQARCLDLFGIGSFIGDRKPCPLHGTGEGTRSAGPAGTSDGDANDEPF
jgi:hypothetical protein